MRREESVSAGTKSIAPVTVNTLPVFVAGIPTPTIKNSIYAQSADATSIIAGGVQNANGVKGISVGAAESALVFENRLQIGASASAGRNGDISIGKRASTDGANVGTWPGAIAIGTDSLCNEGPGVAIGQHARIIFSGLGTPNTGHICIGYNATVQVVFGSAGCIAIGHNSMVQGTYATGLGASVSVLHNGSIAIGYSATTAKAGECVIGDNATPIVLVTVRAGAGVRVKHRSGGAGGWGVRDLADANDIFAVDESAVAGDSRMLIWDVSGTTLGLKRVTFGADNSAGAGFKWLRVVN